MSNMKKAPLGQFRVLCVDTFDKSDWVHGDYDTKEEAIKQADKNSGNMLKAYVYNDNGDHLYNAGTF